MSIKRIFTVLFAVMMVLGTMAACAGAPTPTEAPATAAPTEAPAAADPTEAPAATEAPTEAPEATEAPTEEPAAEPVEISVLHYIDMSASGSLEEMDAVWGAFDDAHPEIKVVRQDEFNDPYHNAIEAGAAAGTLPDLMYMWPSGRSTTLHTQKLVKDLMPLMERDGLVENYIPAATDPKNQAGGYQAMIPQANTATHIFMVNKDVLSAVGLEPATTYSELVAQVPVLRDAGYETVMMANMDTWVMQSCLFSLVAGRFAGEGWEQKILSGEAKFTDPDFVAALNFIKQMYDDGVLSQTSIALGYGDAPGQFATDKAAYYIDGDWRVGAFITDATTGVALIDPAKQENIDITVFPEIDLPGVKFNRSNSAVLGTGFGMNANLEDGAPETEAAWELLKWLVGKETQEFRLRVGGIAIPSWVGIDYDALPLEPLQVKLANEFGSTFDTATVVIDGVFEAPVHTPINDGLQAIGMGTQTPEQVAEITQAAFDAWNTAQ